MSLIMQLYLQLHIQRSNERICRLEDELSKTGLLQSEADDLMLRLDDVCAQLNTAQNELGEKEETNACLTEQMSAQEHVVEEVNKELDLMGIEQGTIVGRMKNVSDLIMSIMDESKEKDQEVLGLKKGVEDLVIKVNEATGTIQKRDDEILRLESAVADMRDAITALKKESASKDLEIGGLRDNVDKLNGGYAVKSFEVTVQIERLESDIAEANLQITKYAKDLEAKDQNIFDLQETLDDVNLEINARSSEHSERDVAIEKLSKELKDSRSHTFSLEEELLAKNVLLGEMREDSDKEVGRLNSDLVANDEKIVESRVVIESLSRELEGLKASHKSEVADFQHLVQESNSKQEIFENDINAKNSEIDRLRRDVEKLKSSLELRDDECEGLRSSLAQIERLELDLADAKDLISNHAEDLEAKEAVLQESDAKLESFKDVISAKDAEIDRLRGDYSILELSLGEELRSSLTASESKVLSLEEELDDLAIQAEEEREDAERKISILGQEVNDRECEIRALLANIDELSSETQNSERHNRTDNSYVALEAANEQLQSELSVSTALLNATESELNSKILELQGDADELKQNIQNKDAERDQLCRELKLMELESIKSNELTGPIGKGNGNVAPLASMKSFGIQVDLDSADGSEAKEAVRELLTELNSSLTEKDKALENLVIAQNEVKTLKDVCNQRELETYALETSLRKVTSMVDDDNKDVGSEVRQVIAELVQEIAHMKGRKEECSSCNERQVFITDLSKELECVNKSVDVLTERAATAEESLNNVKDEIQDNQAELRTSSRLLTSIINQRRLSFMGFVEDGVKLPVLVQQIEILLNERSVGHEHDVLQSNSPISSQGHTDETLQKDGESTEKSTGPSNSDVGTGQKPFAVALNDMINQSTEVIQTALSEFNSQCSMEDNDEIFGKLANNSHMIEYGVYETLRRKYDALQEEREELLNETFALMDASTAANAAEILAITRRIENEAEMRVEEYRQETNARIRCFEERLASCTRSS